MADINIFELFPDCVTTRVKLRGILSDFFPTEKMKVNLILNAYDEGIVDDIKSKKELDSIMFGRWKKIMIDNYGINEENAEWVIDYWFSKYGVVVCKKIYNKREEKFSSSKKYNPVSTDASKKSFLTAEGFIDLEKMIAGEKFPKNNLEINDILGSEVKIKFLTCAVRKEFDSRGETSIKLTGEYYGTTDSHVLIFLMMYNARDELIGYSSRTRIRSGFEGQATFSDYVYVPSDEYISKAVIRLVYDPAFV